MAGKLVPPKLEPIDEPGLPDKTLAERPDLRATARRPKPVIESFDRSRIRHGGRSPGAH